MQRRLLGGGNWTIPGSPIIKYENGEVAQWETTKYFNIRKI